MKVVAFAALVAGLLFQTPGSVGVIEQTQTNVPPPTLSASMLLLPPLSYSLNGSLYATSVSVGHSYSGAVDATGASSTGSFGTVTVYISANGYEVLPLAGTSGLVGSGYVTMLSAPDPQATPLYNCQFTIPVGATPGIWTNCTPPVSLVIPPVPVVQSTNVYTGPTVPSKCAAGDVWLNDYTNAKGQISIFSIWLCGPSGTYQKPLLYKQSVN